MRTIARSSKDEQRALSLVRARKAVLLVPDLAEAIAGEPIRGSWWSHAKGKDIFRIANKLEEAPDVLTAKLIAGKVTFLHAALWPALVRVVTDVSWRAGRRGWCDEAARRLLARVERGGRLIASDRALTKARKALESSLLVRSTQEHTESGAHATVLESWRRWAPEDVTRAAARLTLESALATLRAHRIELA